MAIVSSKEQDNEVITGMITLEDIIENLLNAEIYDEFDQKMQFSKYEGRSNNLGLISPNRLVLGNHWPITRIVTGEYHLLPN